jgi:hypothetical protein
MKPMPKIAVRALCHYTLDKGRVVMPETRP